MTLTTTQALIIVGAVTLGTVITRFLPFLLFPDNKPIPKVVEYLGRTLPAAMMGPLVVVTALHLWKRNVLLSIGAGTVVYMLLVQLVFV